MAKGKKAKEELTPEERLAGALVPVEEQPYPVPENWCWTYIRYAYEVTSSKRVHKEDWFAQGIPFYRTRELVKLSNQGYVNNELFISTELYEKFKEAYGVPQIGDLLISGVGTIGVPYIIESNQKIYFKDGNVIWFKNHMLLTAKYTYYLYKSVFMGNQIHAMSSGTTVDTYTIVNANMTQIPVPPLLEQQRIVDRIENLFAKLDEAKEKAQVVVDGFETRKAAILHKAFTGKLTEQWRKLHPARPNTMLSDIKNFSYNWQKKDQKFLAEEQDKSEIVILDNGHEWVKCTIGAVSRVTNGSTPSRKVPEFWNGTIPWISSGEVKNNIIDSTNECITQKGFDNSSVKLLPIGTVLIAMIGEGKTRGQSSVLNIQATINQNIAAVIIDHGLISSRYIWYWFQMNYAKNREKGSGSGPQALNCQRVRELDFYVPNYTEQNEIVRILDDLLAKEQQAKEAAEAVLDQIETMKKTILARAFRGELGTNDPAEGSAVELLKSVLD